MSLAEIRALLDRHGLRLRRDLGQNFLIDPATALRLVTCAGVEPGDRVLEVGTGLGILTRALAARAERVVSVEVDAGLVRALRAESLLPDHVELVHADALRNDLGDWLDRLAQPGEAPLRVVANLPYTAATPLLRRLLDLRERLEDWSVMVQREVAARLVAGPGARDYGSLAVLHQLVAPATRELDLPPAAFFPRPQVVSSFVRIVPHSRPLLGEAELPQVEATLRALFRHRRKTLRRGLRLAGFAGTLEGVCRSLEIDPGLRAEVLAPERLLALARGLGPVPAVGG